jgi:hypothetical protein
MNASNGSWSPPVATDDLDFGARVAEELQAFKVGINKPRSRGDREEVFGGKGASWKGAFVGGDLLVQAVTEGEGQLYGNFPTYSRLPRDGLRPLRLRQPAHDEGVRRSEELAQLVVGDRAVEDDADPVPLRQVRRVADVIGVGGAQLGAVLRGELERHRAVAGNANTLPGGPPTFATTPPPQGASGHAPGSSRQCASTSSSVTRRSLPVVLDVRSAADTPACPLRIAHRPAPGVARRSTASVPRRSARRRRSRASTPARPAGPTAG